MPQPETNSVKTLDYRFSYFESYFLLLYKQENIKITLISMPIIFDFLFKRKSRRKISLLNLGAKLFGLILVGSMVIFGLLKLTAKKAEAAWFDDTYTYRLRFSFTHNAAISAPRSITFTLNTAQLISANLLQSDCDDLRFTDVNGKALPYDVTGTCNNASTTIEVIFPSIINGTHVGYVYYGNPAAINSEINSAVYTDLTPNGGAPSNANPTSSDEQGKAPISYWSMDEGYGSTANDYSNGANNDLTITNALWRSPEMCVSGPCLYFDGNGDYAIKSNSSDPELVPSTDSFSVSAWFKHSATAGSDTLISRVDAVNGVGWKIYMNGSGNMCFGIDQTAGTFPVDSACSTLSYADSKWHHLTAVKNGTSNITLYINGNEAGQDASITNQSISGTNPDFRVGNDYDNGTNGWDGFIDEVKYYNYSKTSTQVRAEYNSKSTNDASANLGSSGSNLTTLSNGLVGYWKLDESSWTNNCSTGSATDSSGNAQTLTSCPNTTGPTGGATGKFGNSGSFDGTNDYLNINSGGVVSNLQTDEAFTISAWVKPSTISADRTILGNYGGTMLVFGVSNAGTNALMLCINDGVCSSKATSTNNAITTGVWQHVLAVHDGNGNVKIYVNGRDVTSDGTADDVDTGTKTLAIGRGPDYWSGNIDEVRVYNRDLSNKEIESLYNLASGPTAYWRLDENSGTSAQDASANGYSSTLNNGPLWRPGKFGSGLKFDGSDDYIASSSSAVLDTSSPFTVSLWLYPYSDGEGGFGAFFGKSSNFTIYQSTSDRIEVCAEGGSCASTTAYSSNNALTNNRWTYVTVTHDGSGTYNFYANGLGVNGADTTGPDTNSSQPIILGGSSTSSSFNYDGLIDDVKIYNYVRTTKQITEDMNGGHPVGGSPIGSQISYWRLDENQGSSVNDDISTFQNIGTFFGGAAWTRSGKFSSAIDLESSTNSYVSFADSESLSPTGSLTLSAWINPESNTAATIYPIAAKGEDFALVQYGSEIRMYVGSMSNYATTTGANISTGTWYHILGSYDATAQTVTIYVNGLPKTTSVTGSIPSSISNGTSEFNIGRFLSGVYTFQASPTTEDGIETGNTTWNNLGLGNNYGFGYYSGIYNDLEGGIRFNGVNLDGTVSEAHLELYRVAAASVGSPSSVFGKIYADDVDDAAAWGSSSRPSQITPTTAAIDWDPTSFADGWVSSPSITTVIQEIFDRAGWTGSSTSDLRIALWNDGTTGINAMAFRDYESGSSTAAKLVITMSGGSDNYYDGLIDEVKIYGTALTQSEVLIDYNRNSAIALGGGADHTDESFSLPAPLVWYKLDENSGTTTIRDSSGNNYTPTYYGTNTNIWRPGKIGSAIYLDGVQTVNETHLYLPPNILDSVTQGSISLWFKPNDTGDNLQSFFGSVVGSGYFFIGFDRSTDSLVYTFTGDGTTCSSNSTDFRGSVALNGQTSWHHVVVSNDANGNRVYLDGVRQTMTYTDGSSSSTCFFNQWSNASDQYYSVGCSSGNLGTTGCYEPEMFEGLIDDFRIYSTPLTGAQAAYIYNRGAPQVQYKFDECSGTAIHNSIPNASNQTTGWDATLTIGATGSNTSAGSCAGGSTESWFNGAVGKYSSSIDLDGTDDLVSLTDNSIYTIDPTQNYSWSFWVKPDSFPADTWKSFYSLYVDANNYFNIYIMSNNNGAYGPITNGISAGFSQSGTANELIQHSNNNVLAAGTWAHVTVTYDGSLSNDNKIKIYVNGINVTDTTDNYSTGTLVTHNPTSIYISNFDGSSEYWGGQVDDFRYYTYTLSPTQIKTVHNEGSAVRFGPPTGSP